MADFSLVIGNKNYSSWSMRFATYAVELPPVAQAYADAVRDLPAVRAWAEAARRETAFVAADEPYASANQV